MQSMEDRPELIWVDGKLIPGREARIHLLSYTFLYGAGVFEGVRAYETPRGTEIFRLREHTDRLFNSAHILAMSIPFSKDEINAAQLAVVRENQLKRAYIRPLVYYDGKAVGVSAAGNGVHVAIATWNADAYFSAEAHERGIRLKTSSYSRHHVNAAMCKAKANGHYINSMLANMEAKQSGFDDGLLLDTQGFVAECSTSNLFIVRGGRLATPERATVLEGITRDTIMALALERGYAVEERRITRDEIYCAEECFITGTAAEVTPIVELDGRRIGSGQPGLLTRLLQAEYRTAVTGGNASKPHWLTFIQPSAG